MKKVNAVNQYLQEALFELLKTKDIDTITISELIKKAGVCRSSFYRNYNFIEDIIKDYVSNLFIKINKETPVDGDEIEHLDNLYNTIYKERNKLCLLEKRKLISLLDNSILDFIKDMTMAFEKESSIYDIYFYAGSFIYLIKAWIKDGFKLQPNEIRDLSRTFTKDWGRS